MDAVLSDKRARLAQILREMESALVCYSGGVDSAFLMKAAVDALGDGAVALTAESPSLPRRELEAAAALARELGVRHVLRESAEVQQADYAKNPANRCYFCKAELMRVAFAVAAEQHCRFVLLGTNADELGGHRPGLRAANERAARHPLVEAGLTKAEVRELSRALGLPTWDKPQMACLASRFPYGTPITPERLERVERFEAGLADLGFVGLRVRFHETIARIELAPEQMQRALASPRREQIVALGKQLGFNYVTIDLAGYRTGALNEVLAPAAAAPDPDQVARALKPA